MKEASPQKNVKPENATAVNLYLLGYSVTQISKMQDRTAASIASAIQRARRRTPEIKDLKKQYNFVAEKTKLDIRVGALIPTITHELCPKIQKWVLQKTLEDNYDSIASFFTDLAAEAYFADQ